MILKLSVKNYRISPLAEEAFSHPCLLEAGLRPTAGFVCLSRSLPNITGNAIIPLSLSSPRELCIAMAPQCVWLGVLSRKCFLAPLPPTALSRWAGNWEPCRQPMAGHEAGAAHRTHGQPQAGEKRVQRGARFSRGSQQSSVPTALCGRVGPRTQGPTAPPEPQGHAEEPRPRTWGLTSTPWPD